MTVRWSYTKARQCAERIAKSRTARCREIAREAGIDPTMFGLHAHNALVSLHYGRPWKGIDYSLVRKVKWLEGHIFDGYRALDRYCHKRDKEDRFWISKSK